MPARLLLLCYAGLCVEQLPAAKRPPGMDDRTKGPGNDSTPRMSKQPFRLHGVVALIGLLCFTEIATAADLWRRQLQPFLRLRIYGGDTIVGRREKHLVGYYDVPPDQWTTIEFEDRLVEPNGTYQPKPLPRLFVSMLQRLGLETDTFAASTGTMDGLEMI